MALDQLGHPRPVDAPVLPDAEEHESGILRSNLASRICQREHLGSGGLVGNSTSSGGGIVHGIRLIAIAADFLCVKCAQEFPGLNIRELDSHGLDEWCSRLRLRFLPDTTNEAKQK